MLRTSTDLNTLFDGAARLAKHGHEGDGAAGEGHLRRA